MKVLRFKAPFGDVEKLVEVSLDEGGTWWWNVLIDRYYQGNIIKRAGRWQAGHLAGNSILTADDILILGEMIDNRYGEPAENEL